MANSDPYADLAGGADPYADEIGPHPWLPLFRKLEGSADDAVSPAGAVGRYQIMPATARAYGFDPGQLKDPAYNARVAATILADNQQRTGGRLDDSAVLFNASPKVYRRWVQAGRDPSVLPAETRKYLARLDQLTGNSFSAAPQDPSDPYDPRNAARPAAPAAAPQAATPPDRTPLERIAELGQGFVSGAAKGVAGMARGMAGMLETEANTASEAGMMPFVPGQLPQQLSAQDTQQARQEIRANPHPTEQAVAKTVSPLEAWGAANAPQNPDAFGKVGEFAGGMAPMLATGVLGPGGAIAGFQASGYDQGEQDALAHGAPPAQAEASGGYNAAIGGVLGAVPIGEGVGALVEGAGLKGIPAWLAARGISAPAMGGLMAGQQVGSNVIAQQTYDPNRPWTQQTGDAFVGGMLGDVGFHVAHAGAAGAIGGARSALGAGWNWSKGALRPAERPAGAPTVDAETMPAADAIQRYAGLEPSGPEMPEGGAVEPAQAAQAKAAAMQEGDPVLVETPQGLVKGDVVSVDHPEQGSPVVTASVGGTEVQAPVENTVALPKDFEAEREAYGAPLEQMPQAIADVTALRQSPKGYSLFNAIKDLGGIRTRDENGELNAVGEILKGGKFPPGMVNNKAGLDVDQMRETLQGRDWFGTVDRSQTADEVGAQNGDDIDHLLEALKRERGGEKVFHPETQTGEALAHRDQLDNEMISAGVALSDPPQEAAAKLARWRADQVRLSSVDAEALRRRAEELDVKLRDGASYEEMLGDVLEREAIIAEGGRLPSEGYEDLIEDAIDRAITPEQRLQHAILSADDHEWLSHPDRGPRGVEGEALGADDHGPGAGTQAGGAGEAAASGAGAAGGGADQGGAAEASRLEAPPSAHEQEWPPELHDAYQAMVEAAHDKRLKPSEYAKIAGRFQQLERKFRGAPSERQKLGSGETVEQGLLPGTERSARQAAEAREGALKPKARQSDDLGDLFDTGRRQEQDLFAGKPKDIAATPEAKEAQAREEAPKPGEGYGDKNKLVSRDQYEEAKRRLQAKFRDQLNAGLDPEMIYLGTQMAAFHLEAGARKLGDFVRAMVDDLGEGAVPYLKMWYEGARHYPGNDYAETMTPAGHVDDATINRIASDVLRSRPGLEPDRPGAAAADADGAQPVPAVGAEADRGPGGAGAGDAAAGDRTGGGGGLQRDGAAAVGESGAPGARAGEPGSAGGAAGRGEPVGGGAPRDEGIQPDRTPATSLDAVAGEAAHLEPVSQGAQPDSLSVDAPPVSHELEAALPTLYPAQRGDVAFAEARFDRADREPEKAHPGVLFTNGTGTGKTYTGLGIVKRFLDRGKREVLIVAPTQGILNQWVRDGANVGVHINILEDTGSAGRGVTATTYANLGQNKTLADRKWDLVVSDEAHKLTENQAGDETLALAALRAITNHPKRRWLKAEMQLRDEVAKVEALGPKQKSDRPTPQYLAARQALDDKIRAKVETFKGEPRAKAAFLSATPFPYDKSVDWGNGYLFDYGPEPQGRGYNQPDAQGAFFMRHFGYRMRYGKLTKPEAAVQSEVMERQFHEWLRREGALSGRMLDIDKDYDRRFVLVPSAVGQKIDAALTFLREGDEGKFRPLADIIGKRFDHLARARLLEAIKAKEAIPIIRKHLALGRKVVIFHQYNDGGGFSPFEWSPEMAMATSDPLKAKQLHREFMERHPEAATIDADLNGLGSPIAQLTQAFPEAMLYNGRVPKGQREKVKAAFNTDGNGKNIVIVQADAGEAGISLHDTTGQHQRALLNLGLPIKPSTAIQQEGRIYRDGNQSDALFRYLNTGTTWERSAFASRMAERSGTAENLAMGERARAMREAYINAFLDSGAYPPAKGEGKGGKHADRALTKALTEWDKAKSFYFGQQKLRGRRDQREGLDYFPTPEPLGLKMSQWSDPRPGDDMLEPSAGHGAIARWFPETTNRDLVEPSVDLASKAELNAPGANVINDRFENLYIGNKYDSIVMNPPFGAGGATAIDHLAKAVGHLKDGGRVVALIPTGPAADARFEKFYDSDAAKGVYMVADIALPESTFERAGTKVRARVVVLERQIDAKKADRIQQRNIDLTSAGSIAELFEKLEHLNLQERQVPADSNAIQTPLESAPKATERLQAAVLAQPQHGGFDFDQTVHGKTGADLFVASARNRVSSEEYKAMLALAKQHGGWYSSFRGKGAIPGFQFKTPEERQAFVEATQAAATSPAFSRDPVFYSSLERTVQVSPMKAAPAQQWKATLGNAPGIKKEELDWTGLNDWLDLFPKGDKVSKDAVQAFLRDNGVKVEERLNKAAEGWSPAEQRMIDQRQSEVHDRLVERKADDLMERNPDLEEDEALEHARELISYDDAEEQAANELMAEGKIAGAPQFHDWNMEGGEDYHELLLTLPKEANPPQTHWDTPGVLAHVRFDSRESPDGKRVLMVQEIQSDWHQKGRDQGYLGPGSEQKIREAQDAAHAAETEAHEAGRRFNEAVNSWLDKRIPQVSAEYDKAYAGPMGMSDPLAVRAGREHDLLTRLRTQIANNGRDYVKTNAILSSPFWEEARQVPEELRDRHDEILAKRLKATELNQHHSALRSGIPDAPFKSSWPALVMKRVIRWAAEHGYDRVAWTTGEQQGERYNLTKHIGRVTFHDNSARGTGEPKMEGGPSFGTLIVHDPSGHKVLERQVGAGLHENAAAREAAVRKDLEETLGKELTERLLAQEARSAPGGGGWRVRERHLEGLDVKTGDEGMKAFYDRNLVNITNDLVKKYGAKVGKVTIEHPELPEARDTLEVEQRRMAQAQRDGDPTERERRRLAAAQERIDELSPGFEQHGFEITDKMRDAAMGGFPLFTRKEDLRPTEGTTSGAERLGEPAKLDFKLPKSVRAFRALEPDAKAQAIVEAVGKELQRLAPFAEAHAMGALRDDAGRELEGVAYRSGLRHLVLWSLERAEGGVGVVRHEAVHILRKAGLFRPEEWDALASQAQSEGWIDRYHVAERYPDLPYDGQLEEAIAEHVRFYRPQPDSFAGAAVRKIRDVLGAVRDFARGLLGKLPDAKDVLNRLERGAIGDRLGRESHDVAAVDQPAFARRPARSEPEPEEDERAPGGFIARALGQGAENVGRKLKGIAERFTPDPVLDAIDDLKLKTTPMGLGSTDAQAEAKDFANAVRAVDFQHGRVDEWLTQHFPIEQRKLMWEAADEHGVLLRRGVEPGPGQGLNRLTDRQRAVVERLQGQADRAFEMAQEHGMTNAEGLESYVPRMVVKMTALGGKLVSPSGGRRGAKEGANLSTTTGQLRQRKYETVGETEEAAREHFGDSAMVVRDIRTLNLATQRLERAVAGKILVDKIKETAARVGAEPVVEGGGNPDPATYFTMDHPALQKWGIREFVTDPETGKTRPKLDENGDPIFERQPIWIPKDYEGPLAAVLSTPTGGLVRGLLELKSKMIGVVMYNPMTHNAVIWGKAIPADPKGVLTFQAYRDGYAAKTDPETMNEALSAGLDPIGHRFFRQDLASIANDPTIVPGRSWTAQVLGKVGDVFGRDNGDKVRATVDRLGDVWHNTFLWDRIADLQMGLYVKIRDQLLRQSNELGISQKDAQRIAAHFANRYAGALPMESMSKVARNMANLILFSRSFTLGNLAAYKDVIAGLPSDVRSQIEREGGQERLNSAQGVARRKAIGMLVLDMGLSGVGLSLAALMTAWLTQQKWQAPWDNEAGRENRFLIGYQQDGTAIYGRLPTGKVGEELYDWATSPRDIFIRKLSPYGRFAYLLATNDKGFGQKLNDPSEHVPVAGPVKHLLTAAWQSFGPPALLPTGQFEGLRDMAETDDKSSAALRAFLPLIGVTVSRGAPGGPAVGELYAARNRHDFEVQQAMPDIRRQIRAGNVQEARAAMSKLGIAPTLQNYYVRTTLNPALRLSPRQQRDFARYATTDEKARMASAKAAAASRVGQSTDEEQ